MGQLVIITKKDFFQHSRFLILALSFWRSDPDPNVPYQNLGKENRGKMGLEKVFLWNKSLPTFAARNDIERKMI